MSTVLVIGEPGSGKSYAIESLDPKTTVIITPNNKDLPFEGGDAKYNSAAKNRFTFNTFKAVGEVIKQVNTAAPHVKTLIIEDFTHILSQKTMEDANVKGFDKWTELAVLAFKNIIETITNGSLRADLDIILIGHADAVQDSMGNQEVGLQTPGKLMDRMVKIPSYFNYVLHAFVDFDGEEAKYIFQTNRDGRRLAKSSKDMFPMYIPNDYKAIFARIHSFKAGRKDENIIESAK